MATEPAPPFTAALDPSTTAPPVAALGQRHTAADHAHTFFAVGFAENFRMRSLATLLPQPHKGTGVAPVTVDGGTAFVFPFGVVTFQNVPAASRSAFLERVRGHLDGPGTLVAEESFDVREAADAELAVHEGALVLDALTPARASVVALTLAQSVAMDHYEAVIERMSEETGKLVEKLRRTGSAPLGVRQLHRFIGEAVSARNVVLSVLHLLEKPDATWDDPAMDLIYDDLRDEFELGTRFAALETRLRSVQEALELILDVVRDRRLVWLEAAIVILIVLEIAMTVPGLLR